MITITYGLPGSGKTYYCNNQSNFMTDVVHMDDYIVDGKYLPLEEVLGNNTKHSDIIIDCLCTTNKQLKEILSELSEICLYFGFGRSIKFKIVSFEGTREACKKNIERRNDGRNVSTTIDNLPYEDVNEYDIRKFVDDYSLQNNIKVTVIFEKRKIYEGTPWDKYFQPIIDSSYESKGKYLVSESWSLGGTWGDCWGNKGKISPDEQPSSFREFDKLLEEVCPNITFLQYKSIYDECVEVYKYDESDYYGGTQYYAQYRLDLRKCYDMLLEKDIISE